MTFFRFLLLFVMYVFCINKFYNNHNLKIILVYWPDILDLSIFLYWTLGYLSLVCLAKYITNAIHYVYNLVNKIYCFSIMSYFFLFMGKPLIFFLILLLVKIWSFWNDRDHYSACLNSSYIHTYHFCVANLSYWNHAYNCYFLFKF